MSRYEEYRQYRDEGLTYREIAEKCGVSPQAVAQAIENREGRHLFRPVKKSVCCYEGLRNWMNQHEVCVSELCRRMGTSAYGSYGGFRESLKKYGVLRMKDIDKLIEITGIPYRLLFHYDGGDSSVSDK